MEEDLSLNIIDDVLGAISFSEVAFDKFYQDYGISRIQFRALFYIVKDKTGGISLSCLGKKMFVTKPNITTLINRMEAKGFVMRKTYEKDRRVVNVLATPKGEEMVSLILPKINEFTKSIFSCLKPEELETVNNIFQKLRLHIQSNFNLR